MKRLIPFILIPLAISSCSKEKRSDKAALKMQDFVVNISNYARSLDQDFMIIPQNGIELAFSNCDTAEGFNTTYLSAIDGVGIESLFYEGDLISDDGRLSMANQLKNASKKILVADYLNNDANISNAILQSQSHGFICFPRANNNYDYKYIPDSTINENTNNINTLQDAQNYLYLINTDNFSSKQQMLDAIKVTNFDVVIIDLFFNDEIITASELSQIRTKANGGKRLLISYINVGAAENWRYYWKSKWNTIHPCWMKRKYEGYPDERWVKFWDNDWQEIIYGNDDSYIRKIIDSGFDGAYLDNVEAYYFLYFKD